MNILNPLDMLSWRRRGFAAPCPNSIKRTCILRNGLSNSTWVETGTYKGDTTSLLARNARFVHSIEPAKQLYDQSQRKLKKFDNVSLHFGTSEEVFPILIPTLNGDVSFWLDGHFSAGETFKAEKDTPIVKELSTISANIENFSQLAILIDDIRCFDPLVPEFKDYPSRLFLVEWAEELGLAWHIEHDIFIARTRVV